MGKVIIWSRLTLKHVKSIHEFILEESGPLTTADKLINRILTSSQMSEQPEIHPPDMF